jgi:hypothetical protein
MFPLSVGTWEGNIFVRYGKKAIKWPLRKKDPVFPLRAILLTSLENITTGTCRLSTWESNIKVLIHMLSPKLVSLRNSQVKHQLPGSTSVSVKDSRFFILDFYDLNYRFPFCFKIRNSICVQMEFHNLNEKRMLYNLKQIIVC